MKLKYLAFALKINAVRGQGMTEYIIIVALIAVAAIGVSLLWKYCTFKLQ